MTLIFPHDAIALKSRESWPPFNKQMNLDFDWTQPTVAIYKEDAAEHSTDSLEFSESFASARKKLDYSYHTPLVLPRQLLQDAVLERITTAATGNTSSLSNETYSDNRPWMIFTAGPMGVGKGYCLAHISTMIGLDRYIHIDPDKLKQELPELSGYLQVDQASAGTKLHPESTHMADILLEHALQTESPVIIDGSLRDVDYYTSFLHRIRQSHPSYRIAIIHVTASDEIIRQRAEERGKRSGRFIPAALLQSSIEQVPQSVAHLTPLTDAVFVISNNDSLRLESSRVRRQDKDMELTIGPGWDVFAAHFSDRKNKKNDLGATTATAAPLAPTMAAAFSCPVSHATACRLWRAAFPNMCARCALACDGQCGICSHGKHMCSPCADCERAGVAVN